MSDERAGAIVQILVGLAAVALAVYALLCLLGYATAVLALVSLSGRILGRFRHTLASVAVLTCLGLATTAATVHLAFMAVDALPALEKFGFVEFRWLIAVNAPPLAVAACLVVAFLTCSVWAFAVSHRRGPEVRGLEMEREGLEARKRRLVIQESAAAQGNRRMELTLRDVEAEKRKLEWSQRSERARVATESAAIERRLAELLETDGLAGHLVSRCFAIQEAEVARMSVSRLRSEVGRGARSTDEGTAGTLRFLALERALVQHEASQLSKAKGLEALEECITKVRSESSLASAQMAKAREELKAVTARLGTVLASLEQLDAKARTEPIYLS